MPDNYFISKHYSTVVDRHIAMRRYCTIRWISLSLIFGVVGVSRGDYVLHQVPPAALGVLVVKNIGDIDTKTVQLFKKFKVNFPSPLFFLQTSTGMREGLNSEGDFMLVILPSRGTPSSKPRFALWLPVRDYAQLLTSLQGSSEERITVVTVAGENVLIAQRGEWALVMDPDERQQMEQLLASEPSPPPPLASWNDWIEANDIAVVMLQNGIRTTLSWAMQTERNRLDTHPGPKDQSDEDPFGFGGASQSNDPFVTIPATPPDNIQFAIQAAIRKAANRSPQLAKWLLQASAAGCAMRLDDRENMQAEVRVKLANSAVDTKANAQSPVQSQSLALYQGGEFVLNGGGKVSPSLASIVAEVWVRSLIHDLHTQERMELPAVATAQFAQAVERAAAEVVSASVFTQPGQAQDGIYTNSFLVLQTRQSTSFVDQCTAALRLWNAINQQARGGTPLIFEVDAVTIGPRTATQYSLDIAAADGAPPLPEIRHTMEKFFGPGGKLRLWAVPVDDQIVLLASATVEQVTAALEILDRKLTADWSRPELLTTNQLLPQDADWRLFFSPHGYNTWLKRQSEAIVAAAVIGGPLVKHFPSCPPVGSAGGVRNSELWFEVVLPAETLTGLATYLQQ